MKVIIAKVIVTIVALCSLPKFDQVVSKIRSEKLRYTLSFLVYAILLGVSIYFRMKVLRAICILVILSDALKIIVNAHVRQELEEKQRQQDKKDRIVYTLKESEYREIN